MSQYPDLARGGACPLPPDGGYQNLYLRHSPATRRRWPAAASGHLVAAALQHVGVVPWRSLWAKGLWTTKTDLARLATPFLEEGERIEHSLVAFRSILDLHWAIVVTDRAILVLEPAAIRPGFARWIRGAQARRLPRATRLGPIYGQGWILLDGQRFFIPGQKRKIEAIDSEAGFPPQPA